jgi:hypothetical protein
MPHIARGYWVAWTRLLAILFMVCGIASRADASAPDAFILDLPGGASLPGGFAPMDAVAGEGRETFRWKTGLFIDPLEFRLDAVAGIRAVKAPSTPPDLTGFRCQLRGGDLIDGSLVAIDADAVVLKPAGADTAVRIDRGNVTSIRRRNGGEGTVYVGPGGLVGWQQEPADAWHDEAARLTSEHRNATIARNIAASPRARYDITLSWRETPDVVIAIAAGDGKQPEPYRIELTKEAAGGHAGLIIRQEGKASNYEKVVISSLDKGRLRMSLFVDVAKGRLAILVDGVEKVVETTAPPTNGKPPSGRFAMTLRSGDICLESLRVTEWTTPDPGAQERADTAVVTRTGRIITGGIESLDAALDSVIVATAEGATTVALSEVEAIDLAGAEATPPAENAVEPSAAAIRVLTHAGGVLTGNLLAVSDKGVDVGRSGVTGGVAVPFADILTVTSLESASPPPLPGRSGVLVMGDARVPGCIVDAAAWGGGIAWQATGSLGASGFASGDQAGFSAEVEYRPTAARSGPLASDQAEIGGVGASIGIDDDGAFSVTMVVEDGAAARDGRIEPGARILAVRPTPHGPFVETKGVDLEHVMNLLRGRVGTPVGVRVESPGGKRQTVNLVRGLLYVADREVLAVALAAHARVAAAAVTQEAQRGYPAIMALCSGDLIPVAVERIDAAGVRLRSPVTAEAGRESAVVAGNLVKAIELDPSASTQGIPRDIFERLLTVPRSQQSDPPTHLLRLRTGDYLRGKLLSLDDSQVTFEVVGQQKKLPRQAVVRLIWLHPEHLVDDTSKEEKNADAVSREHDGGLLVQGLGASGERTTLEVERVDGKAIVGQSPAFGPSRIDTTRIDRLLIGAAITAGDDDLPFAKWRLKLAPLPRALREKK